MLHTREELSVLSLHTFFGCNLFVVKGRKEEITGPEPAIQGRLAFMGVLADVLHLYYQAGLPESVQTVPVARYALVMTAAGLTRCILERATNCL